jgi:hypothetical protein
MNGFSAEEVAAAFGWAEQHVSPGKRDTIAAARAMAHLFTGARWKLASVWQP